MHERTRRVGSRLDFWAETAAGTEVALTVPATMARAKRLGERPGVRTRDLFRDSKEKFGA
jgi:hypothetical protein